MNRKLKLEGTAKMKWIQWLSMGRVRKPMKKFEVFSAWICGPNLFAGKECM